jgi:PAS domain S-box-containing protein
VSELEPFYPRLREPAATLPLSEAARAEPESRNGRSRPLSSGPGSDDEGRLALVQRVAKIGVFERDVRDGRVWWSPQVLAIFGFPTDGPAPTFEESLANVFEDDRPALQQALAGAAGSAGSGTVAFRFWRGEELRSAEAYIEALTEDGMVVGYRGAVQDRTDHERQEAAARHELTLRSSLLDAVDAAVAATDGEGLVTHWNAAAERLYGWTAAEVIGKPLLSFAIGEDRQAAEKITNTFIALGHWEGDYEIPHRDGSSVVASLHLSAILDPEGDPVGVVAVSVDIGPRVAIETDLRRARDYLQAITGSMAEGLITLDCDGRLTYMNDAAEDLLGWRQEGLVGERVSALAMTRSDLGGGPARSSFAGAALDPGDAPMRVDSELIIGRDHAEIEVSYTAASFESELGDQGTVIVFADVTEQRAVERLAREKLEGLSWIGKIRDGLDHGRIVAFAQPIVLLATGEVAHQELLVRMLDECGRPIPPASFLSVAEEFGLIAEIDELMARRAVELAARGHQVNLNLSAASVAKPGISAFIGAEIERLGADPSRLTVELTETSLVKNDKAARNFVEGLAQMGCRFALDDFGTGYGGFTYLKQLPIDYLKIDMEFVRDLTLNEGSQRVVRAVVDLARGFGQLTVAEGVEDEGTRDMLSAMGVDFGQGYLFGRPEPIDLVFSADQGGPDE